MIFCDESGCTGTNLIDKNQPSFSYVSNDFTKEEALELLEYFNTGQQKKEVKFSKIIKLKDIASRYENFFSSKIFNNKRVVISLYNKQFYLITKLVDTVIEPILYDHGYDLYKDRLQLQTALYIYYNLNLNYPAPDKESFLLSFKNFIKNKNTDSLNIFLEATNNILSQSRDDTFQNMLSVYLDYPDNILENISSPNMFDAITTAAYEHINIWGQRKNICNLVVTKDTKLLELFIDNAKSLEHESFGDFIQSMKAKVGDEIKLIGNAEHKFTIFLPIKDYKLVNSIDYPQIQVSDVIAGFINFVYNHKEDNDNQLVQIYKRFQPDIYPIIPEAFNEADFNTDGNLSLVDELTDLYIKRKNK